MKNSVSFLIEKFLRGEVPRSEMGRITGKADSTARLILNELVKKELLYSETPKSPVRLNIPASQSEYFFPKLFGK